MEMDSEELRDRLPKVRVAVVDDDEDVRFLVAVWIRSDARFELCGQATGGREAVSLAGREQPDVMILDVMMPGMGGLEAVPLIRACSPSTRIVLFTASPIPDAARAHVDAVISKEKTRCDLLDALLPGPETGCGSDRWAR